MPILIPIVQALVSTMIPCMIASSRGGLHGCYNIAVGEGVVGSTHGSSPTTHPARSVMLTPLRRGSQSRPRVVLILSQYIGMSPSRSQEIPLALFDKNIRRHVGDVH